MNRFILANAFSPSMLNLNLYESETVNIMKIDLDMFKDVSKVADECAIGHPGTAALVREITGRDLRCERKQVTLEKGDVLLVVVLKFRPPEGKVYGYDELKSLFDEGQLEFYVVTVGDKEITTGRHAIALIH